MTNSTTNNSREIDEMEKKKSGLNLEAALDSIGYGKFQWQISLVAGLGNIAAGFQMILNAYLIPAASCDLEMDSLKMGILNSAFMAGCVCSTYIWGLMADLIGRKKVLFWTLLIDAILTFASSFIQQYEIFCFFRFCSGFLIASPSGLFFAYLGEFHSLKDSPRSICLIGFFFTLSWLIFPGICWFVLPMDWSYYSLDGTFTYNSWRVLVAIVSIPLLLAAIFVAIEPETPKFLVSQGKYKEAERVLKQMQLMNFGETAIKSLPELILDDEELLNNNFNKNQNKNTLSGLLGAMWYQTKQLFKPPLFSLTLLFSALIFCNVFAYFGLGFWLPELFNRLEQHAITYPNESVTVCEISMIMEDGEENLTCTDSINSKVFLNTIVIGVVTILTNLLSVILSKKLEYRVLPVSLTFASGVCVLAIYLLRSPVGNLTAASLFQASISAANYAITSVIIDIFPTYVRGVGLSVGLLAGRIASVIANLLLGQLLVYNCHLMFGIIIGVIFFGGILCFFIPKNKSTT